MPDWLVNLILGVVEGLTEFLPVSSTGHILLLGHFLGFESTGKTFEVLIQLGAILAILSVYFGRLINLALALPSEPKARRFIAGILLAFFPSALAGVLLHGFIKTVLFETPMLICIMLIVGGVILLLVMLGLEYNAKELMGSLNRSRMAGGIAGVLASRKGP